MKILATIFLTILANTAFSQRIFTINNFSKDYYGKVQIEDSSAEDSSYLDGSGWIAIYDRKTNKQIIKVAADELFLELHNDKPLANMSILPYGEQSVIMYADFNFDGKKDFAIEDGQNSCYHGPSFKVYLATPNGFIFNKEFTRLAQEYCGMFDIDPKAKRIYTMTKDGCCWHQFSEFMVVNNEPKAIKIATDDEEDMPFDVFTTKTWNGKSMVKKSVRTIDTDQDGIENILSFYVPKYKKQVILFNINDGMLYYALVRKDSTVEFSYPIEAVYKSHDFKFDTTRNNLSVTFKNKNTIYTVYDQPDKIGIKINTNGETSTWVGDASTKSGSLEKLRKIALDNVYYK